MAKGGFVVNWDGKQMRCHYLELDYDEHSLSFHSAGTKSEIKDWSTISIHAVTKKDAERVVLEPEEFVGVNPKGGKCIPVKEVKKDA